MKNEARKRENLQKVISNLQDSFTALEKCRKPIIASIHNACIGAGVDLICAADIRLATKEAYFQIKEIDIGIVADLGTLQRLPKLIPAGIAHEWALTGQKQKAEKAAHFGFVNHVYDDDEQLQRATQEMAAVLAQKAPLALRGTKRSLLHARDHTVAQGLEDVSVWNAGMLLSTDAAEAMTAQFEKRPPKFEN